MDIKKLWTCGLAAFSVLLSASDAYCAADGDEVWDKVFAKNDNVSVRKVTFTNRFGIELVGDLYEPIKKTPEPMAAIAVSGPFGAVKEQASGLYAQELADRGFVTLAFDPSFTGESGGQVRHVASPDINTDDFSAAVDYLSTLPEVDPHKIGIVGICGFGGFGLNAAAQDTRIKATVASTMYDMTRVSAKGYNDSMSAEELYALREKLNDQRTQDYKNAAFAPADGLPDKLTGDEPLFVKEYFDYYKTPRGFHPRSINSNGHWNVTSSLSLITQPILAYSDTIRNAVLLVHGSKAHSRYFSEDAFKKLQGENKELYIVEDANHVDLYDNMEKIPFAKMEEFFRKYLR